MEVQLTDQSLLELVNFKIANIMAQIKETYASLNDANIQKYQSLDPLKKTNKIDKANKKLKRTLRQNDKPFTQDDNIKVESQDMQQHLDQFKSKFNSIFKNFVENVKGEILKTEQELLKISHFK
ncbi:unnamed protein product [Paramecium sonneborni]|uniref:Uncharacterized protein n=1 Tax=Paramecium sonneborni TaxID=65129 RepID=A0A8S1JUK8_9CILI|nr:unnamed protein product [Paramecium sonneborni]